MNKVTKVGREYRFNGEKIRRHFGPSGGYRHTYFVKDAEGRSCVLKLDIKPEDSSDWKYYQTAGEIAFYTTLNEDDKRYFPTVLDHGTYLNGRTVCAWILEEYISMEAVPSELDLKLCSEEYFEVARSIIRRYRLGDVSVSKYWGNYNVGITLTENPEPVFYDFGSNPLTPYSAMAHY
mgnify:CR=1 FL=1